MHTLINLIDNTITGGILDGVRQRGYTTSHLLFPNCGEVIKSDLYAKGSKVYFFNYGMIRLDNCFAIEDKNIFLCDDQLVKKGVIVERSMQTQGDDFIVRDQEFFRVVLSNCDVPEGSFIVVKERTACLFNYGDKKLYYCGEDTVLLNITLSGVVAGPHKALIKKIIPDNPFAKEPEYHGLWVHQIAHFKDKEAAVVISGVEYFVVHCDKIYALEDICPST